MLRPHNFFDRNPAIDLRTGSPAPTKRAAPSATQ